MNIAVASGKGGTGKTTVATNLARLAAQAGRQVAYVDCDVEEPNGHLFLKPRIISTRSAGIRVPQVDAVACTLCGRCGDLCQYSAIVPLAGKVVVHATLCHGCGGCARICPAGAITEVDRPIGVVEVGHADGIEFVHGILQVGEAMSPPLIRAVKAAAPAADLRILDAPPGSSCPVIESIRGADRLLLVTEPTPFGLHDLRLAVAMAQALGMPMGVVINRSDVGDDATRAYCRQAGIPILAEIPDSRAVAEAYSRGVLACEAVPGFRRRFGALLARIDAAGEARPADV